MRTLQTIENRHLLLKIRILSEVLATASKPYYMPDGGGELSTKVSTQSLGEVSTRQQTSVSFAVNGVARVLRAPQYCQ